MDPLWLAIAYALGLGARYVGLPPLVGFLAAGFVLNALGAEGGELLQSIADLGVTLLLFTIGLKLSVKSLARPEVWGVASLHMLSVVLLFGLGVYALAGVGLGLFAGMDLGAALLLAFALSFSSTVYAVKVLEDKGEMAALHGRIAIGILIMQDIAAVVFLAASTGKIPSFYALGLLLLFPLRTVLIKLMERSGHGELLVLFGLLLALGTAELFDMVKVKGDLGALIVGMLLAGHPKASELARSLLSFKDLFLVGFFLTIGLSGEPSLATLGLALLLAAAVPVKTLLYFWLLARFKLRARTALLTGLPLSNYSEFGLIVGAIAVANEWLAPEWLIVCALSLAITFIVASPLTANSDELYARFRDRLLPFESDKRLPEEEPIYVSGVSMAIFGMGRVGTSAYDTLRARFGEGVLGVDFDAETVREHRAAGRNVIRGSATDPDFFSRLHVAEGECRLAMLAMPSHQENLHAARLLKESGFQGFIAAVTKYADELDALEEAGVQAAYNIYSEAGVGFADEVSERLGVELAAGRQA